MNKVILKGNITKDIELKTTTSGVEIVSFTLAVNRNFKNKEGNYDSDFINIIAYKQTATFISKYFHKGSKILLEGRIQTRNYDDKEGKKVYVTEVIAENVELIDKKENLENSNIEVPTNYKSNYEGGNDTSIELNDEDIDKAFTVDLPF